jgi:vacuole membrane protein 1
MDTKINQFKLANKYVNRLYYQHIYNHIKLYISIILTYIVLNIFSYELYQFNLLLFNIIYWLGLGILSTIGLGFGFHTGIFFLFPYIINYYEDNPNLNIYYSVLYCLPQIILWGIGSALGELPPYLLTYNCDDENLEIINNRKLKALCTNIYNIIKNNIDCSNKIIIFLGILIMSSWPNLTFDMCGMLCGYYKLTINEFLIPTVLGKGFIKAPIQCLVVLYFYTNNTDYSITNYLPANLNIMFNIFFILLLSVFLDKSIIKLAHLEKNYQIVNKDE